jgi:hypothetical protein
MFSTANLTENIREDTKNIKVVAARAMRVCCFSGLQTVRILISSLLLDALACSQKALTDFVILLCFALCPHASYWTDFREI